MFVDRTVIRAGAFKVDRDPLFERVSRLEFADARGGEMRVEAVRLGGVKVGIVESSGHVILLSAPGEASFLAPFSGRLGIDATRRRLGAASGGGVFMRPGDRETTVGRDGRGAYRALVALAPMRRARGGAPGFSMADVSAHPAMRSLGDLLGHLLTQAGREGSVLARSRSRKAAEALITDGFAALDEFDAPLSPSEATAQDRVRLAEAYIRARSDEPLTVAAIAAAVGVGARALQAGFRDRLGLSPRALLAEVRLERARERLLAAQPGVTVADVAFESGFAHGGRFAAAYRRRFGESPSETLAHALGPGASHEMLR